VIVFSFKVLPAARRVAGIKPRAERSETLGNESFIIFRPVRAEEWWITPATFQSAKYFILFIPRVSPATAGLVRPPPDRPWAGFLRPVGAKAKSNQIYFHSSEVVAFDLILIKFG
jgi:hypothetical protein